MNRSNYDEDIAGWQLIMWRGAVSSAIRGRRGQKLLIDMVSALDAMPHKVLVDYELINGGVCALGAVGVFRGMEDDFRNIHPEDVRGIARKLDVSDALVREISYLNDECGCSNESPGDKWARMRDWAVSNISGDKK